MKHSFTLFICLLALLSFSQKEEFEVVNYSFNNGSTSDEINSLQAKARGALLTYDRFGNPNSAYYLHGNYSSYINLGTSKFLKLREATISMWFKVDFPVWAGKGVEVNNIILARCSEGDDYNDAYGMAYELNTGIVAGYVGVSKLKQVAAYSKDSLQLRTWHHAVLCYNDKMMSFYLDGKEVGSMTKNFESKFLEGDSVMIGYRNGEKNQRFFNGSVDDIEIFNKILSEKEISELYNAPNPNKNAVFWNRTWICLLVLLIILILIWGIKKRIDHVIKKEKERNQLIHHSMEQEIKMLKAQMDPHFIFNSLNTILQFIITSENKKAELYLTKFAKLLRKLLESNTKDSISLEDEIDLLNKYLEIESIRFAKVINTIIEIDKTINPSTIFIPHMLIQPFVENAIWHGLRLKEGDKTLKISFTYFNDKCLKCTIDDNGVGRNDLQQTESLEKNKSLAINFIRQRLDLLSKLNGFNYGLNIIDKKNEQGQSEGTKIEIDIPLFKK